MELREVSWCRVETGQRLVGAGMPQGGVAAAEQQLCSSGMTGHGVLGLWAALAWGMGFLVQRGWLKGAEPEISACAPRIGILARFAG